MSEGVCYVLVFSGVLWVCCVCGWYVYVGYVEVFVLCEVNFSDLEFCLVCIDVVRNVERCVGYALFNVSQ